jgi:hypothetical protein
LVKRCGILAAITFVAGGCEIIDKVGTSRRERFDMVDDGTQ